MSRPTPILVVLGKQEASRVNKLKDALFEGGSSLSIFVKNALLAECDSRGLVADKTPSELAEEALAAGNEKEASKILLEDMKSKLKDEKDRLDKLKSDRESRKKKQAGKPGTP